MSTGAERDPWNALARWTPPGLVPGAHVGDDVIEYRGRRTHVGANELEDFLAKLAQCR